jgi:protein-arginine kinase activator protein McsA
VHKEYMINKVCIHCSQMWFELVESGYVLCSICYKLETQSIVSEKV